MLKERAVPATGNCFEPLPLFGPIRFQAPVTTMAQVSPIRVKIPSWNTKTAAKNRWEALPKR